MIYYYVFGGMSFLCAMYFAPFGGLKRLRGIKSLSKEERNNIRLTALGINLCAIMLVLSAIFILSGAVDFFREYLFKWFIIAWFVAAFLDAIFIGKSNYYFKNNYTGGKNNEKKKNRNP